MVKRLMMLSKDKYHFDEYNYTISLRALASDRLRAIAAIAASSAD